MARSSGSDVEWLIAQVRIGNNVSVHKLPGLQRRLVVKSAVGDPVDSIELDPDEYERLMSELVTTLAALDAARGSVVKVKRDFYGAQWVEVRSGTFRMTVSRLGISPRHIARLEAALATPAISRSATQVAHPLQ